MFSLFLEAVLSFPANIAFVLSDKNKITYEEAYSIVNYWSQYLISIGISQGDRIAILTLNEDLHPFIHLALDRLNATAVPFDSDIPKAQLPVDLKKLDLKVILIDELLCEQYNIPETGAASK